MKSLFLIMLLAVAASALPAASSGQPGHVSIEPRVGVPHLLNPLRLDDSRPVLRTVPGGDDVQGSLGLTLVSTMALGVVGGLAGGALGNATAPDGFCGDDSCGLGQALLGGFIGLAVGSGVGAHIGNGSRGSLGLDIVGGALGAAVGVGLLAATSGGDSAGAALFIPIPMVLIPVLFERSGARRNYRKRSLSASVAPAPGGLAIALKARW